MVKGMEEYFFKDVQAMSFGEAKPVQENLYLAVLQKESTNYRIFQHNLARKVDEFVEKTGIKPTERFNENLEDEKERKKQE